MTTAAPEPATEESRLAFDPRALLGMLLKHKWVIVGTTAIVSTLVLFWTLRQPKLYEAVCSIEYDPNPPRPLRSEIEDVADPIGNFWMTREFYETQNRIIRSRGIAERVVRKLGLHRDPGFAGIPRNERRRGWRRISVGRAAFLVQSRLTVEQERDTRLVYVRYRDGSPERAQLIANAIVDAYIEKTIEDRLGTTVSALEWLRTQLDNLKHQLETSELALHQFKEEHDILSVSMEDRQNIVAQDIQHFSESLTAVRTKRIELQARLQQLRQAAQQDPLEVQAPIITDNAAVMTLRTAYRTKMAERTSLAVRYGPQHPRIRALDAELTTLRAQVANEVNGLIRSVESSVREAQGTETGLRAALGEANNAGLAINLREIEYGRLNREKENNAKLYSIVLQRTTETNLTKLMRVTHVRIVDRAEAPAAHVSPRMTVNVGAGMFGGLLLGLALAVLRSRMDRTVRSAEDVQGLGLTILGVIPSIDDGPKASRPRYGRRARRDEQPIGNKDLIVHTHPMSSVAECCRAVRTNLTFMSADNPLRALVVTSAGPREGKTTVATSLAIAMAQSGKRVLLVDTDLRRPRIHRTFGLSATTGITSVLVAETRLSSAVQETTVPGLFVLPCGPIPPNPSELLHTSRFRQLIVEALESFDRIIFDSPPIGAVTDAAIIAPQVQGTIVVIKAGETSRDAGRSSVRQLHDVGANVVGAVLNDVDLSQRGYGYGQYYYYYRREGYYSSDVDDREHRSPDAE